ncbi:MAG: hypothetical protein Q8R16_01980 [bacterium]|nr:hypothetical protein [bacterium]
MIPQPMIPRRDRRGATLLLALIILGGIVATSLTVGTVVITRLRSVKMIDDSILASYAAESGVEELLHALRKEGRRTDLNGTGVLANGATWERTVDTTMRELFLVLEQDATEQLDLTATSGALEVVDVRTLLITATAPAEDAWLEVTWLPWLNTGSWAPTLGRVLFSPSELASQSQKIVDLRSQPMDGDPIAYRVRLRSIGASVGSVRIRAASDALGTNEVAFPSRIRATVVGTVGATRYAARVEFPAWSSVTPVFDYVLFSECDIVKGGVVDCPP